MEAAGGLKVPRRAETERTGYDIDHFLEPPGDRFICSICIGILRDPVETPDCEHLFCRYCIGKWLATSGTCPLDRKRIASADLIKPANFLIRNLISGLQLTCPHKEHGCPEDLIFTVATIEDHLVACDFNPANWMHCDRGCDQQIKTATADRHRCLDTLKEIITDLRDECASLRTTISILQEDSTGDRHGRRSESDRPRSRPPPATFAAAALREPTRSSAARTTPARPVYNYDHMFPPLSPS